MRAYVQIRSSNCTTSELWAHGFRLRRARARVAAAVTSPTVDVTQIEEALGRLEEGLSEARMAAEMMAEGDVTAVSDLNAVIDAMALEIAELKGRTSGGIG
jgi:hypothetical protein